ncbi:hypothetical protein SAMN05444365_101469 [Micromonospora pattaloongensis]|uniref:Uncharacterized protein n=1 Tax=Micromonospora pattaloongensis TaxID=405436 RepID=A0A1H3GM35_9ACTN|nr:hypothetical protein SAMN05444365_101469 [Micromonospora pattaloongensis]
MPTSVLLAVLAAAGLLALAPALVRRYDATERLVAERAQSTARVLQRRRRRRTVPGRRPVNPPRLVVTLRAGVPSDDPVSGPPAAAPTSGPPGSGRRGRLRAVPRSAGRPRRRPPTRRHTPAVYRRRRVFAALVLLNFVELVGVVVVSPGFWIGFSVTATLLAAYMVHMRNRALIDRRRRRAEAREAAWLAARQAEVRREQARRAAARREAQRRLAAQREAVRRAAMGLDRPSDVPAAASGGGVAGSVSYRRAGGLRGRAYEAGGHGAAHSA